MCRLNRYKSIMLITGILLGSGTNTILALQLQMVAPGQYGRNPVGSTRTQAATSTTASPTVQPQTWTGRQNAQVPGKTDSVRAQLPDLVIGRLYTSTHGIHSGDTISLRVKVSNRSSTSIRGIKVRFLNQQRRQVLAEKTLNLAAGAFSVSQLNTPVFGNGRTNIVAIIDPNRRITERNETNNTAQIQLSITPAAMRTSRIITPSPTPTSNSSVLRSRQLHRASGLFLTQQAKMVVSGSIAGNKKTPDSQPPRPQLGLAVTPGGQARGFDSKKQQFRTFGITAAASLPGQQAVTIKRKLKPLKRTDTTLKITTLPLHRSTLVFGSRIRERVRMGKNGSTIPGDDGQGANPGGPGFGSGVFGGINEPGVDDAPPFGGNGGTPGPINDPTGMGNPADRIMTPDKMGQYDPIGSMGDLYGGVNPSIDPRLGGHVGAGAKGGSKSADKESGYDRYFMTNPKEAMIVFDPNAPRSYGYAIGVVVEDHDNYTTLTYFFGDAFQSHLRKKIRTIIKKSFVIDSNKNEKGSTAGIDNRGNQGSHQMLSEAQKRKIREAQLQQTYDDVTHGPAIQSEGGVIDPVRNQADGNSNHKSSEKNQGQSADQRQSAMLAKQPGSWKPGSELTGNGRIDRDNKSSKSIKKPQGFHVVDPKANQGITTSRIDTAKIGSKTEILRGQLGDMGEQTSGMLEGRMSAGQTGRKSPLMTGELAPADYGNQGGANSKGGLGGLHGAKGSSKPEDPMHKQQRQQHQFSGTKRGQAMDSGDSSDNGDQGSVSSSDHSSQDSAGNSDSAGSGGNAGGGSEHASGAGSTAKGASHSTIRHALGTIWNAIEKATDDDSSPSFGPNAVVGVRGMPNPQGDNGGAQPAGPVHTGRLVDAPTSHQIRRIPTASLDKGSQVDAAHRRSGGPVGSLPIQQGITDPSEH